MHMSTKLLGREINVKENCKTTRLFLNSQKLLEIFFVSLTNFGEHEPLKFGTHVRAEVFDSLYIC